MANGRLTPHQSRFISEYLLCMNATRAAIRAGYSPKTARQMGYENLTKPYIKDEIERIFMEQKMSPDEIMARLADQARGDMGDLLDESTMTINWRGALDAGKTHLVKKIKQTIITTEDHQTEILELELHDAQKALVSLGRTYALFADKLKLETWQDRAIEDIRNGVIIYQDLEEEFDSDLAAQLFARAGVRISLPENTE